ncbi:hypothetical protein E2C01_091697 [Portunus trituberculatus]|uniref:Uncharacterized protein n=1 Tax=Portunus trituberculatus TaxID=210409 RepID=A0A5B7JNM9_PORTR|nr:hypothetical protein [Portunus trituberculatus]
MQTSTVDDMHHEDLLSYFEDAFNFIKDGQEKGNVLLFWSIKKCYSCHMFPDEEVQTVSR